LTSILLINILPKLRMINKLQQQHKQTQSCKIATAYNEYYYSFIFC